VAGELAIAVQAGTQSELAGDLLAGGDGTLVDRAVHVNSVSYRDVYAGKLRLQGLIGYGVADQVEVVARGGWYESEGGGIGVGTFAGRDLFAFFTDHKEWNLELGLRYYIAHRTRLKSHIGPVVGLRSLDPVFVSYSAPDAGTAVLNVPLTEDSTVPVFGADIGLSFEVTPNFFLALDSGIRWSGKAKAAHALSGLGVVDDSDSRWTAPVVFSVGFRFGGEE
jgi:hypothetical protein